MTARRTHNGIRRFGLWRAASALPGGSDRRPQDGRDIVESGNYENREYVGYDGNGPATQPYAFAEGFADPERHAGHRGKAARTWRAGKAVPLVAVAAAVVAGTATAYVLGGGQPQAAQLHAAATLPGAATAATSGAGSANANASALVKVARANASAARASARAAASAAARHTLAASPSAAAPSAPAAPATRAARTQSSARWSGAQSKVQGTAATGAGAPAAAVTTAASANNPATATTLSCNLNSGMVPQNVTAIVSFLVAHGYSNNAAAGIAGNIYQESKGNPESIGMGGGGLIGWTPLPSGFVTGNAAADLTTQLNALLTYNQGWSSYLPALNSAASPAAAADIYVTDFERAGIPAASTREASATAVASACGI